LHSKIGYSRTAAAAAAYLLQIEKDGGVGSAVERLRQLRPTIVVRQEVLLVLTDFARNAVIGGGADLSLPSPNAKLRIR